MKLKILSLIILFISIPVIAQNKTIDKLEFTSGLNSVWEVKTADMEDGLGAGLI